MNLDKIIKLSNELSKQMDELTFSLPVKYVYNPLSYSFLTYLQYLNRINFNDVNIYIGINPGPYGMSQTGIPFGDYYFVKNFLNIKKEKLLNLPLTHHKKPIYGFDINKREASGKRLWAFFQDIYKDQEIFFKNNIILNYCPLCFLNEEGNNITPDKLIKEERNILYKICDDYLNKSINLFKFKSVIGIGNFAYNRAKILGYNALKIGHPSPLNIKGSGGRWELDTKEILKKNNLI